jgi:hypothetical protein
MAEQPQHQSIEEEVLSPTTIISIVSQVVTSGLEEAGYKDASRVIKTWPKLLGKNTVRLLKNIFDKKKQGKPITPEEHEELAQELQKDQRDAAVLLGLLTAGILDDTLDAKTARKAVLESYNVAFNLVCAYMTAATTSVALRGFIHDKECISYWERAGNTPKFSLINGDYLYPFGLDVYVLYEEPTDVRLAELNQRIYKSYDRRLPAPEFNIKTNERVAVLEKVLETSIVIKRLDPDRADKPPREKDPIFGSKGIDYNEPVEIELDIEPGAPALIGLTQSLTAAKAVQHYHLDKLKGTEEEILKNKEKAS